MGRQGAVVGAGVAARRRWLVCPERARLQFLAILWSQFFFRLLVDARSGGASHCDGLPGTAACVYANARTSATRRRRRPRCRRRRRTKSLARLRRRRGFSGNLQSEYVRVARMRASFRVSVVRVGGARSTRQESRAVGAMWTTACAARAAHVRSPPRAGPSCARPLRRARPSASGDGVIAGGALRELRLIARGCLGSSRAWHGARLVSVRRAWAGKSSSIAARLKQHLAWRRSIRLVKHARCPHAGLMCGTNPP